MLSVILNWFYMAVTTFLLGYGILTGLSALTGYSVKWFGSFTMCGLAGAAVYAQIFSLFAPVGAAAGLLLCAVCLGSAFLCRDRLIKDWRQRMRDFGELRKTSERKAWFGVTGFLLLFLLFAYGTSRGILHYDTALYHAQSIRWIEEYGVVKGLGNLHCRLAYNSSSFALSALYSMVFLGGQSYHCAAGFLALTVAALCLEPVRTVGKRRLRPSDFARVMGIYYLLMIFDEMISPASDYFMVLMAFWLIIRWMDLLEAEEKEIFPFAMLCVLSAFLLTVKLSAALIVLFTLKPALSLLRERRWKETGIYLGLGILTVLPYLIRNVILSGWLVYPFTGIDMFRVDWKIPEGIAAYDAREIQVWGRGYSDVTKYGLPVWEWMPGWFRGLGGTEKIFVLAAVLSVLVFGLRFVRWAVRKGKAPGEHLFPEAVVSLCFLFWLFSSPLIRYGCVYVYLTTAVVWGDVCTEFFEESHRTGRKCGRHMEKACMLLISLFLVYKAAAFGREIVSSYVNDYWLCQKDYDNYETESYEIDGVLFYRPVSGDQTGYESFPSSPATAAVRLRGTDIGAGFCYRE